MVMGQPYKGGKTRAVEVLDNSSPKGNNNFFKSLLKNMYNQS